MMSTSIADIELQALQLSPEDRAHLADRLLASLRDDGEIEDAWSVEAERRLAELEGGSVSGIPVEVAIAQARDAIR
jgi:putative addiction module component (TIGR02574 family)